MSRGIWFACASIEFPTWEKTQDHRGSQNNGIQHKMLSHYK
jgi:hypothetical protein